MRSVFSMQLEYWYDKSTFGPFWRCLQPRNICSVAGDKEQTKQGLQELKNFQAQCPHADLEPFLAKSSSYFRKYIERGLASIEPTTSSSSSVLPSSSSSDMLSGGGGSGGIGGGTHILSENRGVSGGDGNTPSAFLK